MRLNPGESITLDIADAEVTLKQEKIVGLWTDRAVQTRGQELIAGTLCQQRVEIGSVWPGQGGIYAGLVFSDEGKPLHRLVVHELEALAKTWKQAQDACAAIVCDGHKDFIVPWRRDARTLIATVPHLFAKEWYWLGERYAGNPECAWAQNFGNGTQDSSRTAF